MLVTYPTIIVPDFYRFHLTVVSGVTSFHKETSSGLVIFDRVPEACSTALCRVDAGEHKYILKFGYECRLMHESHTRPSK